MRTHLVVGTHVFRGLPVVLGETPVLDFRTGVRFPVIGAMRQYDMPLELAATITSYEELGVNLILAGSDEGVIFTAEEGEDELLQKPALVTPSAKETESALVLWVLKHFPDAKEAQHVEEHPQTILLGTQGRGYHSLLLCLYPGEVFQMRFRFDDGMLGYALQARNGRYHDIRVLKLRQIVGASVTCEDVTVKRSWDALRI